MIGVMEEKGLWRGVWKTVRPMTITVPHGLAEEIEAVCAECGEKRSRVIVAAVREGLEAVRVGCRGDVK